LPDFGIFLTAQELPANPIQDSCEGWRYARMEDYVALARACRDIPTQSLGEFSRTMDGGSLICGCLSFPDLYCYGIMEKFSSPWSPRYDEIGEKQMDLKYEIFEAIVVPRYIVQRYCWLVIGI